MRNNFTRKISGRKMGLKGWELTSEVCFSPGRDLRGFWFWVWRTGVKYVLIYLLLEWTLG